jgi:outer membrane protein
MKNLLKTSILVVLIALSIETFGQTDQGKFLLGGASDMTTVFGKNKYKDNNSSNDSYSYLNFNFSPQIGFFVIDNLAVGASLPISFNSMEESNDDPDKYKYFSAGFAPFVRYYIGSGKIKPFGYTGIGFGSTKNTHDSSLGNTTTTKYGYFSFELGAGAAFFINDNVALDLGLGFDSYATKAKENNPDDLRSITTGFGLNIGVTALF